MVRRKVQGGSLNRRILSASHGHYRRGLSLRLHQAVEYPLARQELLVGADLRYPAFVQHHQAVSAAECGKTVCDGQRRSTLHQAGDGLLNLLFRGGVQG